MTGTPRKTASRRAQPRKVAPAAVSAVPQVEEDDDAFDLASVLEVDGGAPKPIKLLGVRGHVLRTYTGEQAIAFSSIVAAQEFGVMLELITDVGEDLWAKIGPMEPRRAAELLNKIVEMSGLHEGKLLAFSLPSEPGTVGTPLSPDSAASTT